jgi:opioid growth factor receptor-like protein
MSRLTDFYLGEATDTEERHVEDIWAWGDDDLEEVHDYVQWLFPTPQESLFNSDAPVLSDEDVAAFRSDPLLRDRLRRSFVRFLSFLGLALLEDGRVAEGDNFHHVAAGYNLILSHSSIHEPFSVERP